MSTGTSRVNCEGCGCALRVRDDLTGLIHCPHCGTLIGLVEKDPQDIRMAMLERKPDIGARSQAQAECSTALAELVQATTGSAAPSAARYVARLREAKARRNTAVIWLSVLLVLLAAVGGVCYWFCTHPLLRVVAPDGTVLYEGRPSEDDAPRITKAVLSQYQEDVDAATQSHSKTATPTVQGPERSSESRGTQAPGGKASPGSRDADIFETNDRLKSAGSP